jgi:hypothetical protein
LLPLDQPGGPLILRSGAHGAIERGLQLSDGEQRVDRPDRLAFLDRLGGDEIGQRCQDRIAFEQVPPSRGQDGIQDGQRDPAHLLLLVRLGDVDELNVQLRDGLVCFPWGHARMVQGLPIRRAVGAGQGLAARASLDRRYLIRGLRSSKFKAGDLLQWDTSRGDLTGLMQEWQATSVQLHHRIACWVLESNSAFRHLTQYDHFRVWMRRWGAGVILHKTTSNKWDEQTGIEALLPPLYRQGLKRLPKKHGDLDALGFVTKFTKELCQYPEGATKDLVMADWQSEWQMARILAVGRRTPGSAIVEAKLPKYLRRKQHEVPLGEGALA